MKPTICIFIFCLVIAFLLCTSSSPTVVQAKHQPNASKGIPLGLGSYHSGQSAAENNRLAFESIIAMHNTYFIVFIAGLSVYFGIIGACWRFAFGANHKAPISKFARVLSLSISFLIGGALFIGMRYGLDICAKHQCSLDKLAAKLDICSIDLSLLPDSAEISMFVIAGLGAASLVLVFLVVKGVIRQ